MVENLEQEILVVEDDPAIRRLVTMVLKRAGYRIETASDGLEAVGKLGLTDYEVIVLDLMMPNLDGFAFLSAMERNDPARLRKVIVTSAASASVIRERMHGVPFALLSKPFDITDLLGQVRLCISAQHTDPLAEAMDQPICRSIIMQSDSTVIREKS